VLLVAAIVVAPIVFVGQKLITELRDGIRAADISSASLQARLNEHSRLAVAFAWVQSRLDLEQQLRSLAGTIGRRVSTWISGSIWFATRLFLTFLTLFYFFRDRAELLRFFRKLIPLSEGETDEVFRRIAETVNTSVYRNLLVKMVQGLLGGVMFAILGLPAPVLCGIAMALFAVLPVLGTALIWLPAAVGLALSGSWIKAIILAGWGAFVIGLIDNFLFPLLVAGRLRLHPLAVFFSIFGGLIAFGVAGVVLGPVILAITSALLENWQRKAEAPA
jgi:predicted PurR-regulated permease PerM